MSELELELEPVPKLKLKVGSGVKRFLEWLGEHYRPQFAFTPLAIVNRKVMCKTAGDAALGVTLWTDYTIVYVFGLRIVILQRSTPW